MMTGRDRFFNKLNGFPTDRTPVFPLLMFYAAKCAGISYREFARNGSALAEAQLLMSEKFPLDAITVCSDAFRVSADLNGEVIYPEEGTPYLAKPIIRKKSDFDRLPKPDPTLGRMGDRVKAVDIMANSIGERCAVLGWVEMPYAEASDLVGVADFMMLALEDPAFAHEILNWITDIEIEFAFAQIDAGADMIGAGDAAASLISPDMYREFALPYERKIVNAIHNAGSYVKLHICGNTQNHLPYMVQCDADLFNIDHMVSFTSARDIYSSAGKCYKGNLDPVADFLESTPEQCEKRAHMLMKIAGDTGYMLSAGCEIPKDTSDSIFEAFCYAPQSLSRE